MACCEGCARNGGSCKGGCTTQPDFLEPGNGLGAALGEPAVVGSWFKSVTPPQGAIDAFNAAGVVSDGITAVYECGPRAANNNFVVEGYTSITIFGGQVWARSYVPRDTPKYWWWSGPAVVPAYYYPVPPTDAGIKYCYLKTVGYVRPLPHPPGYNGPRGGRLQGNETLGAVTPPPPPTPWSTYALWTVGILGAGALIYRETHKRKSNPAHDDFIGRRVELSPHFDLWMRGARYGVVRKVEGDILVIKMDHPQVKKLVRARKEDVTLI